MSQPQINLSEKPNCYTIVTAGANPFILEALGDRLIIQEDKFKTGYECKICDGEGYTNEMCPMCVGRNLPAGSEDTDGTPCRMCILAERGTTGLHHGKGFKTCESCKGRGSTIVLPQESVRRPTTGVITSVGPDVKVCPDCNGWGTFERIGDLVLDHAEDTTNNPKGKPSIIPVKSDVACPRCEGYGKLLRVGMRVIYAIFAGTAIEFKSKGTCRILHENEIMGIIYGTANLGDIVK